MQHYNTHSLVEKYFLSQTKAQLMYAPIEKIGVLVAPNFPMLGKLTALRFIEWLQHNPKGLIALPTGKTPEYFIKWTVHFFNNWNKAAIKKELHTWGIDSTHKPDLKNYTFVQIDEFYPMNPAQENSFAAYIDRFYFQMFGFDKNKAILMDTWIKGAPSGQTLGELFGNKPVDLSLRYRQPSNELEGAQAKAIAAIDQYAMEYEQHISTLGGIGFFLGGIGPDGHIGFNIRGSDHFSTTRLTPINYETAAAAAGDLGGIEISRQKLVITIGLQTITQNPTTTTLIMAAGNNKAPIVKNAIEQNPSIAYPATALQKLPSARFFLTQGAASYLEERNKAIAKKQTLSTVKKSYNEKINRDLGHYEGNTFLHTAPHHDDIMLGYLPFVVHLVRSASNNHYFATMTSGFTAISNDYASAQLTNLEQHLNRAEATTQKSYSKPQADIYHYLDGVANQNLDQQKKAEANRMLRNIMNLSSQKKGQTLAAIKKQLTELKTYFHQSYPGKKDTPTMQQLKGMIREWEEELLWGHLGFDENHVFHLRLGFYTGDIFTQQPEFDRDVNPILNLLEKTQPDIVTVALDPEGSGPDTHYKVLQAVAQALMFYLKKHPKKKITIWGYRNVWFRFQPDEANIFVPVSMNSLAILKSTFNTCFGSQRAASFPSYEYDGPFCDLAQKIMVEQYNLVKEVLGESFFYEHPIPRLRATRGFCFLKAMTPEEFFQEADILRNQMENSTTL